MVRDSGADLNGTIQPLLTAFTAVSGGVLAAVCGVTRVAELAALATECRKCFAAVTAASLMPEMSPEAGFRNNRPRRGGFTSSTAPARDSSFAWS